MAAPYIKELAVMRKALAASVRIAQKYQKTGFKTTYKREHFVSPVTDADIACEKATRKVLTKEFPSYGLLGEEIGEDGATDKRFLIDPIDATFSYVRNVMFWGSIIALEEKGEIVAGCFSLPMLRETYWASKGGGAFLNGKRIHVSDKATVRESFLSVHHFRHEADYNDLPTTRLQRECNYRVIAGSLFGVGMVASGRMEGYVCPYFGPWDFAASKIVIEEAGGKWTNQKGVKTIYGEKYHLVGEDAPGKLSRGAGDWMVGTNGKIHDEVLRLGWGKGRK